MAAVTEFFEKFLRIDRRWIFVAIAIAVVVPFFLPLALPVVVTPPVQRLYDAVDELESGGPPLLLSIDYTPATSPELEPMSTALLRHVFRKGGRVIVMTLHPAGYGMAESAILAAADEAGAEYGEDFCYLGFQPGTSAVILGLGLLSFGYMTVRSHQVRSQAADRYAEWTTNAPAIAGSSSRPRICGRSTRSSTSFPTAASS